MGSLMAKIIFGLISSGLEVLHRWVAARHASALERRAEAMEARVKSLEEAQADEARIEQAREKVRAEQRERDTAAKKNQAMVEWAKQRLVRKIDTLEGKV